MSFDSKKRAAVKSLFQNNKLREIDPNLVAVM